MFQCEQDGGGETFFAVVEAHVHSFDFGGAGFVWAEGAAADGVFLVKEYECMREEINFIEGCEGFMVDAIADAQFFFQFAGQHDEGGVIGIGAGEMLHVVVSGSVIESSVVVAITI